MNIGPWQIAIILVIVLLLFGTGGKIPKLMRDMGQGINAFKKGLKESKDDKTADAEAGSEDGQKTLTKDANDANQSTMAGQTGTTESAAKETTAKS